MKKQYLWFLLLSILYVSCNLEEIPVSTASKSAVFGSQQGLDLYANSFYSILPGKSTSLDAMADYMAIKSVNTFVQEGAFAPNLSSGWTWTDLRNINYFLANNNDPLVPADVRNNYNGIAKFFRAYFYFEKVKRFGDVPWIGKPLDVTDAALYGPRDSRTLVMDSIVADIDLSLIHI